MNIDGLIGLNDDLTGDHGLGDFSVNNGVTSAGNCLQVFVYWCERPN